MRTKKVLQQLNIHDTTQQNNNKYSHIKQIVHISDIHIRHGDMIYSRYDEYIHVFKNLIVELACLDCVINRCVMFVITGNIFHGKGKLDTPAVKLYFEFMDNLLSFGNVIMICGNHEYRKDDLAHPDMLETMIIPYKNSITKYKLTYLKNTGYYVIDGIGFGVKSISTSSTSSTSNAHDGSNSFPKPDTTLVDKKIALYQHSCNSLHALNNINITHFDDYDYVLMGAYPYHFIDGKYGYPGSFIQQDYNSYYGHHGILLWNICELVKPTFINIENDYGMVVLNKTPSNIDIIYNTYNNTQTNTTVCTNNNAIVIKHNIPFNNTRLPQHSRIKTIGFTKNDLDIFLETHNIKPSHLICTSSIYSLNNEYNANLQNDDQTNINNDMYTNNSTDLINTLGHMICPSNWLLYIETLCNGKDTIKYNNLSEFLANPDIFTINITDDIIFSPDINNKIINRNKRISNALYEYNTQLTSISNYTQSQSKVIFKVLQWSYIMCYGESNYFDFTKMKGQIALLNGNNATGKSAFLDVICIALFGEPSKHRNIISGKQNNGKIIHNKCPSDKNMCVSLTFTVNDCLYEITRIYTYTKPETYTGLKCIEAYIYKDGINNIDTNSIDINNKEIICTNITAVNDWITTNIGTIDNVLLSSFITQIETHNFFNLKQEEQKQLIDNALHLESISGYAKLIKESLLGYNDIIYSLKSHIEIIKNLNNTTINAKDLHKEITHISKSIEHKVQLITTNKDAYNKLLGKIGIIEDFNEIKNVLHKNEITASKRLTQLKRKLESNTYNTITEADINYCQELIHSGQEKHILKYNDLLSLYTSLETEVNELKNALNENEENDEIVSMETLIVKIDELEQNKPFVSLAENVFTKKQKQYNLWLETINSNELHTSWLSNPDELYMLRTNKNDELNDLESTYTNIIKDAISKPQISSVPVVPPLSSINNAQGNLVDIINSINTNTYTRNTLDVLHTLLKQKQDDLYELYNNKIIVTKTEKEYAIWLKTYNAWRKKYARFIDNDNGYGGDDGDDGDVGDGGDDYDDGDEDCENNESIESMKTQLQQTRTYYDSITKKLNEKAELEKEILQIDTEINNLEQIPFNAECWACQQQPMRIRHVQISTYKKQMSHVLHKTLKYLQKVHNENSCDLDTLVVDLQTKMDELEINIKLRELYETTAEIKASEYEMWEEINKNRKLAKLWNTNVANVTNEIETLKTCITYVEYNLWKQWKNTVKNTSTNIAILRDELKEIDDFLASYTLMSELANELDKETKMRTEYITWENTYKIYLQYKTYLEKCTELDALKHELTLHNTHTQVNIELIEKVKAYNSLTNECMLLERYIIYENSNKLFQEIMNDEELLVQMRIQLASLEKDANTIKLYTEKIQLYESHLEIFTIKYELISELETLFVGTSSGSSEGCEGFKIWIYNNHVVPLLQSHINNFLSLIDNISLEISYTNNTFVYTIHDRGNTPNLSLASGYQRFIIGLALRMIFAKISNIDIKHLFIDEGFVACDMYNLDQVHVLFKALYTYGNYESIMLMSHLDSIRNAAEICINIDTSTSGFSKIVFGHTLELPLASSLAFVSPLDKHVNNSTVEVKPKKPDIIIVPGVKKTRKKQEK